MRQPRPLAVNDVVLFRSTAFSSVQSPLALVIKHSIRCIGEDPAAHGHWCTFTNLYHTMPYHIKQIIIFCPQVHV